MDIKTGSEDFIVEEIPRVSEQQSGEYSIYKMTKTRLNTEQAVEIICNVFRLKRSDIKYAGTKDRNASTTQYISIYKGGSGIMLDRDDLKLVFFCYSDEPLSLGSLIGNRFRIIIRNLTEKESQNFEKNKDARFFANYFDEQRFSKDNYEIGLSILKKDFKKAAETMSKTNQRVAEYREKYPNDSIGAMNCLPKKILSLYLHSVQSYIFNEKLKKTISDGSQKDPDMQGSARSLKYSLGEMIFTNDYGQVRDMQITIPGFDSDEDFMFEGLSRKDFIIRQIPELSLETIQRNAVEEIKDLMFEIKGQNIILEFSLAKGCYATIVIKQLFS